VDVIAWHILIQAEADPAAVVTAALRDRQGASEAASVSGCRDVIARAETRDTGELARPVTSRAQAPAPGRGR
jgi:hypothetical protein